jgi:glycosyltransferase involved in cell wall biosynthesis
MCGHARSEAAEKKVIYHGWNTRDSGYVAQHWAEMEEMPFDGIGIGIALDRARPTVGDGSTGNLLGWQVFGARAFRQKDFTAATRDLQQPRWQRFTDNFLPLSIATRDQDAGLSWFDDRRWATIENNWRVLLTIAREGHCRGLLLDPEHYDYECELFNYRHHRAQRADRSFADYAAQARTRGRQLGAAVRELYPDIIISLLYGYHLAVREARDGEPREVWRYALLPAFLDGLIEASAPRAQFVDLWEFGHGYKKSGQFLKGREEIKNATLAGTAIPAVYRSALSPGMSLRIDYEAPRNPWQTTSLTRNYFSPARFESALRGALEASDRYVWIYSEENPKFFPPASLPGAYLDAFRAARQSPLKSRASIPLIPIMAGLGSLLLFILWLPRRARRRAAVAPSGAMRVLFVTGIFPPDGGGPASYVPRIAAAFVRRGHTVEVICLSDRLDHDDAAYPFALRRLRRGQFWPRRIFVTAFTIWRSARRHDLVYVNGLGAESALAAALAGRPAIHKIVGDYAWERAVGRGWFRGTIDEYQVFPKALALRLIDAIRSLPLKFAERIIVPSRYLQGIVAGWGIAVEKVCVISNAVSTAAVPETAPILPPWPGRTLITVCRLVPWKGVGEIIRLLPELPTTRLVIAGHGHLRSELETLAQSLGVTERVVFLGEVPHGAVAGYLAQADAFVLNSTYEGLPHVVLEAIAAEVPVIATDAGGTGEVVQHQVTGLLVRVGDSAGLRTAIEQLWNDPALGQRLVTEAAARSRLHFDFEAMVTATEVTLRAALASPDQPATVPVGEAL